ncbi:MAG: phosphoglycerate kinase [Omnitrophica WOR_2 bacterium GWC2_45_7]|nr:MAG: phosphoglycerate kinase [Omnitrophica WOR_2 bacterium GWC2_45_7]
MGYFNKKGRVCLSYKLFSALLCLTFMISLVIPPGTAYAQLAPPTVLNLPAPGTMLPVTPAFTPVLIRGITVHPENQLLFDFIVDRGADHLDGDALKEESTKLIKYFMAALTVPDEELWVNLSPYEKDRIIPKGFGDTLMGQDLLAQDYILKQLTASMMYPEDELGQTFWNRVYAKAQEKYGTTDIPMNTFNKIWIVPEKAVVYEHKESAFVVESHLKVMLEEDYVALQKNLGVEKYGLDSMGQGDAEIISGVTSAVVREVLIPEIEKEVNEGKHFANLRQVYNSLILATWFKQNLKDSLLGKIYANKSKTKGVDTKDKEVNQKIYNQYVEAFKKGVYDYIKEDYDSATQQVMARKYFSGGNDLSMIAGILKTLKNSYSSRTWKAVFGGARSPLNEGNTVVVTAQEVEISNKIEVDEITAVINPRAFQENKSSLKDKVVAVDGSSVQHLRIVEKLLEQGATVILGWGVDEKIKKDKEEMARFNATLKGLMKRPNQLFVFEKGKLRFKNQARGEKVLEGTFLQQIDFLFSRGYAEHLNAYLGKGKKVDAILPLSEDIEFTEDNNNLLEKLEFGVSIMRVARGEVPILGSSNEVVEAIQGVLNNDKAQLTDITEEERKVGEEYWNGRIKTTPITVPFRASKKGDVVDVTQLPTWQSKTYRRMGGEAVANGEVYFAVLVAGAAQRMDPKIGPQSVKEMVGGREILSKAAVSIGLVDGKVITYFDVFAMNVKRLLDAIHNEDNKSMRLNRAYENNIAFFSNDLYREEHDALLAAHEHYGLPLDKIRFFHQPLRPKYYGRPQDVEKLKASFNSDEEYQKALSFAKEVARKFEKGDKNAILLTSERDPLGHGEFLHQLIASGELLHIIDSGKKVISVKNIDNYAAKFDDMWLKTLGMFIGKELDFQGEVSERVFGQKGGADIINTETGQHQFAEDPNLEATKDSDGKVKVNPTDSYWINNAVGLMAPHFIMNIYKDEGQTYEEFIHELRRATPIEREAIAARGRAKFPKIFDAKIARQRLSDGTKIVAIKGESNLWQGGGVVGPEIRVNVVGVHGPTFGIEEYMKLKKEGKVEGEEAALAGMRFLGTKQWDVPSAKKEEIKQRLSTHLKREPTEAEVELATETYKGNEIIAIDLLKYILHGPIVKPGIFKDSDSAQMAQITNKDRAQLAGGLTPEDLKSFAKQTVFDVDLKDTVMISREEFNGTLDKKTFEITDDTRIREALPNILYAIGQGARIVITAHLGRLQDEEIKFKERFMNEGMEEKEAERKAKEVARDKLSLKRVAKRLEKLLGEEIAKNRNAFPANSGKVYFEVASNNDLPFTTSEEAESFIDGKLEQGQILLLENVRFNEGEEILANAEKKFKKAQKELTQVGRAVDKGEQEETREDLETARKAFKNAEERLIKAKELHGEFSRALYKKADVFVLNAFGAAHRKHASVTGASLLDIPSVAGALMVKEDINLRKIHKSVGAAVIAGLKVKEKIKVMKKFLDNPKLKFLCIAGAMANAFLKAKGYDVGDSKGTDEEDVEIAKGLLVNPKYAEKIILPTAVVAAGYFSNKADHRMFDITQEKLPDPISVMNEKMKTMEQKKWMIVDVGPETVKNFLDKLATLDKEESIVWNGPLGAFDALNFAQDGTKEFIRGLFNKNIIRAAIFGGGGDTIKSYNQYHDEIIKKLVEEGFLNDNTGFSTGGGAFLEHIELEGELEGYTALSLKNDFPRWNAGREQLEADGAMLSEATLRLGIILDAYIRKISENNDNLPKGFANADFMNALIKEFVILPIKKARKDKEKQKIILDEFERILEGIYDLGEVMGSSYNLERSDYLNHEALIRILEHMYKKKEMNEWLPIVKSIRLFVNSSKGFSIDNSDKVSVVQAIDMIITGVFESKLPASFVPAVISSIRNLSGMKAIKDLEDFKIHLKNITINFDPAMVASKDRQGGINLNPALLDLQIKRDGNGVPLPVSEQPFETMRIEGFVPIIINIAPVTNLPMLLGIAQEDVPSPTARETTSRDLSYHNRLGPVEPRKRLEVFLV